MSTTKSNLGDLCLPVGDGRDGLHEGVGTEGLKVEKEPVHDVAGQHVERPVRQRPGLGVREEQQRRDLHNHRRQRRVELDFGRTEKINQLRKSS